jgi:hypothetical protein
MSIVNLYPPIIDTAMPGFVQDNGVNIYFSISDFNSYEDIENAQITITNQYNNLSALDKNKYPSEVMLKTINIDDNRVGDKYYIHINKTDMSEETFKINMYYKVQIRFTSTEASEVSLDTPQQIDS